jgi:hypothetical protein
LFTGNVSANAPMKGGAAGALELIVIGVDAVQFARLARPAPVAQPISPPASGYV